MSKEKLLCIALEKDDKMADISKNIKMSKYWDFKFKAKKCKTLW